jgi:Flp pilus assembly protein TadG
MRLAFIAGFARNRRGGLATIVAIAIPVLAVIGCGAADLSSVVSDKSKMQDVADAAALDGANQLSVANSQGAGDRTKQFAADQLTALAARVTLTTNVTVASDASSITVAIQGHRPSFFGNLLPMGGWNFNAQSTAQPLGRLPLCVLTTSAAGASAGGALTMAGQSLITATGCLVHSNSDMTAPAPADLNAGTPEAVGTASGQITPTPQTGAPPIADPFTNLNLTPPPGCDILPDLLNSLLPIIIPVAHGNHCGKIVIRKNLTVQLQPGVHYFLNGGLELQDNATLEGSNVVLIFDNQSAFQFEDHSQIKLQGMQSGPFAGFVVATTPQNTNTFTISSDSAHLLLGTIYVPNALLSVSGGSTNVADQSAWTVIIAKGLQLTGSPNLVINSNYSSSSVPVPSGVGPSSQGARLVK